MAKGNYYILLLHLLFNGDIKMIIENLTLSDLKILKRIFISPMANTAHTISCGTELGISNVFYRLRIMGGRGVVKKSHTGMYFINPKLKMDVAETLIQYDMLGEKDTEMLKKTHADKKKDANREADAFMAVQAQTSPSSSEIVKEVENQEEI